MKRPSPGFDEWVEYCFTRGCADFSAEGSDTHFFSLEMYFLEDEREQHIAVTDAARFLCRLFRAPAWIAERFTDDQIADGLSFIFGVPSHYFPYVRQDPVPVRLQLELLASLATLYEDLLDHVSCGRGADPDTNYLEDTSLDNAIFMIWDMIGFDPKHVDAGLFPTDAPHQVDLAFDVLEKILSNCRTSTCHTSALHALGHLHARFPQRVTTMIDQFLDRRHVAEWVRDYALIARSGSVL